MGDEARIDLVLDGPQIFFFKTGECTQKLSMKLTSSSCGSFQLNVAKIERLTCRNCFSKVESKLMGFVPAE